MSISYIYMCVCVCEVSKKFTYLRRVVGYVDINIPVCWQVSLRHCIL